MKRLLQRLIAISVVLVLLAGCATNGASPGPDSSGSDATRTKWQGTIGGAILGAAGGAIIGYQKNGMEGAFAGGLIGMAGGAALGYVAGSTVADRKQKYANKEARLDGEIKVVAEYNNQLKNINQKTAARINELDQEISALIVRHQNGSVQVAALSKKQDEIKKLMDANTKTKESMNAELVALNEYQESLNKAQDRTRVAQLKQEIDALKVEVTKLDSSNKQMAQMVQSLNVRS